MKKIIFSALFAIMALTASAQVNAVGIPFGVSKSKAVELLDNKFGAYDYYTSDLIMYKDFRLDGVTYETACFHFKDMVFTSATFHSKTYPPGNSDAATDELLNIVEQLESRYIVVNLVANGASQKYTQGQTTVQTMFRAMPKVTSGDTFVIDLTLYVTYEGTQIIASYSPKTL